MMAAVKEVSNFLASIFNFKTVSSGLAIFIAGALMASGGALINNIYTTAAVPGYVQILSPESKSDDKTNNLVKFL